MTDGTPVNDEPGYGKADATFQAAGGLEGIRRLVDSFYDHMEADALFEPIWSMHPPDRDLSRDKLTLFLCAWMGGPRWYAEKYGGISIPMVHRHLTVQVRERDLWLDCMGRALREQAYPDSLVSYLLTQLAVPAERIRQTSRDDPRP